MKRSELKRRTPLARGKSELKRTPMPRRSSKTAALYRKHGAERIAYVNRVWLCECCCKRQATDPHEITPGANRMIAFCDRRFWLAVCRECNTEHLTGFPLARQLALKKLADPEFYDRDFVLESIGAPLSRVTEAEVDAWITRGPRA